MFQSSLLSVALYIVGATASSSQLIVADDTLPNLLDETLSTIEELRFSLGANRVGYSMSRGTLTLVERERPVFSDDEEFEDMLGWLAEGLVPEPPTEQDRKVGRYANELRMEMKTREELIVMAQTYPVLLLEELTLLLEGHLARRDDIRTRLEYRRPLGVRMDLVDILVADLPQSATPFEPTNFFDGFIKVIFTPQGFSSNEKLVKFVTGSLASQSMTVRAGFRDIWIRQTIPIRAKTRNLEAELIACDREIGRLNRGISKIAPETEDDLFAGLDDPGELELMAV